MSAATTTIAPALKPIRTASTAPAKQLRQVERPAVLEDKTTVTERPVVEPQHMQALARANEVRLARAELKRQIAAGNRSAIEVVLDCPWEAESMTVAELLCSQRRWGRARSRKLINATDLSLSENKRLGTLTARQRKLLAGALEAKTAA